jgi:hypothetical protein
MTKNRSALQMMAMIFTAGPSLLTPNAKLSGWLEGGAKRRR